MKYTFIFLLVFIGKCSFAQNKLSVNYGTDTSSTDNKAIYKLWRSYILSNPDSLYNNPNWNAAEKKQYKNYDLLSRTYFNPSLYTYDYSYRLLSITKMGDHYLLRTLVHQVWNNTFNVVAILNHVAKKVDSRFYLYNYLPYYSAGWGSKTVGLINYHYYPGYVFNLQKADEANRFYSKLCKAFDINAPKLEYYINPDCDGVFKVQGFDYIEGMGSTEDCGLFDEANNIIYATAIGGENHYHELTHIINLHFPHAHPLLMAGISAYWSKDKAHRGKPLIFHIKRFNDYLLKHPEIDLNKVADVYEMDNQTNPQYVLGALICDKALRMGGFTLLKTMFNSGSKDKDLHKAIAEKLNITDLNGYLRNTISYWASQPDFKPVAVF